jgi:hypothetical protein
MIQRILVADLVYSVLSHKFAQGCKSHFKIRLCAVAGFVLQKLYALCERQISS